MIKNRFLLVLLVIMTVTALPTGAAPGAKPAAPAPVARPAVRVENPLTPASPKARKEKLNNILARKEFGKAGPSALDRMLNWIGKQLHILLWRLFGRVGLGPISVSKNVSFIVTLVAVVLFLLLLAYVIARINKVNRTAYAPVLAGEGVYSGPGSPKKALDEASKNASEGNFRNALRLVYLAVLLRLDERELIEFNRTGTNWEYLSMLRKHHKVHDTLKPVTMVFDRKWYGHEPASNDDYKSFVQAYEAVEDSEVNK